MVNADVVPNVEEGGQVRPAKMAPSNTMHKADLVAWFSFFAKHQDEKDTTVSWEDGMIFHPTAIENARDALDGKSSSPH
jgi:hypothetical protein